MKTESAKNLEKNNPNLRGFGLKKSGKNSLFLTAMCYFVFQRDSSFLKTPPIILQTSRTLNYTPETSKSAYKHLRYEFFLFLLFLEA